MSAHRGPTPDDTRRIQIELRGGGPLVSWWLSFCDSNRPEGSHNLGCCIVDIPDGLGMRHAVVRAHELRINPGGQVAGGPLKGIVVADHLKHRLLPPDEARKIAAGL